jgi:hypothetical protein
MNTSTHRHTDDLHRQLQRLTEKGLSPRARYGHVLLMVFAAGMGVLVAALLATEPDLPFRTQAAFSALMVISAGWVGYTAWALARRPFMYAHRVVAAVLASCATGLFAAVTLTVAVLTHSATAWLAGSMGLVMLGLAVVLLRHARSKRRSLLARRDELQRVLARSERSGDC